MARQRYCRRLARYRNTLRVSADPVAKPTAHTRAESRGSRPSKADAGERRTLRWREPDSNHRSREGGPSVPLQLNVLHFVSFPGSLYSARAVPRSSGETQVV